jgi:hypothetical protein
MKIYKLKQDFEHSGDSEKDAFHIPFEHSDKASVIFLNKKYISKLPERIYFESNFNLIPKYDYPLTDLRIPIMSDKLIQLVKSIGKPPIIEVPVVMLDDTYLKPKFDNNGELKADVNFVDSYKAIMLTERYDCFDKKKSDFEPSELNPSKPGYINKLVIKSSDQVLPPIFRINESPSTLLVTEILKDKIQDVGIRGCVFEEVETS